MNIGVSRMNNVRIKPDTNRLRQLVRDHGEWWLVVARSKSMPCFDGQAGMMVMTADGSHSRNVPASIVIEEKEVSDGI